MVTNLAFAEPQFSDGNGGGGEEICYLALTGEEADYLRFILESEGEPETRSILARLVATTSGGNHLRLVIDNAG